MQSISFVVQGPILKDSNSAEGVFSTFEVLKSIRKFYPKSEVILSTWKGADVAGLDYDKVLLNDDPGSIVLPNHPAPFNHNRLIVSSRNGIYNATHDIVVKTRSDIIFVNNNILDKLKHISPVKGAYAIFNNYILSTNYYVRNPLKFNLFFHGSDILLIGKKQDLLLFFSAPVAAYENIVTYNNHIRMVAEQYLMLYSINSSKGSIYNLLEVDLVEGNSTNFWYFINSEKYLFNSFNFFSTTDLGVSFSKKLLYAHRPQDNYSIFETDTLSRRYRKHEYLDMYSYLRGTKYIYSRLKLYVRIKTYMFLEKMKNVKNINNESY